MSVIEQQVAVELQIEKAKRRLHDEDPRQWIREAEGRAPKDLATGEELSARRAFLQRSLGDNVKASQMFERIIAGNELQDVAYLARGARAAQAISRIAIKEPSGALSGWGSGFLIAPGVLITNNHVLSRKERALRSEAHFDFEQDIDGKSLGPVIFRLQPERLFLTNEALDFTVVAVGPEAENARKALATYGYLPLVEQIGKITEGEWLTVIQHPNGERKQVCVRENRFIKKHADVIWYSSDTVGGSSGSPVFNNDWYVVALHHSGVPLEKDGRIQTIDGLDHVSGEGDERIKWIANEGIRVSRIVDALRKTAAQHPLLRPVFESKPENSRIEEFATGWRPVDLPRITTLSSRRSSEETRPMPDIAQFPKTIGLTLTINADGSVDAQAAGGGTLESALLEAAKKKKKSAAFDVPFDATYADRKGYAEDFLGAGKLVNLPVLSPAAKASAAELLPPATAGQHVLKYHNYSVVMHAERRLAMYSAANVDFGSVPRNSSATSTTRTTSSIAVT
jgi:endonuclease G